MALRDGMTDLVARLRSLCDAGTASGQSVRGNSIERALAHGIVFIEVDSRKRPSTNTAVNRPYRQAQALRCFFRREQVATWNGVKLQIGSRKASFSFLFSELVTGFAKRHEILKGIGFEIVGTFTKRLDVVNSRRFSKVGAGLPAALASVIITMQSRRALGQPVGTSIGDGAAPPLVISLAAIRLRAVFSGAFYRAADSIRARGNVKREFLATDWADSDLLFFLKVRIATAFHALFVPDGLTLLRASLAPLQLTWLNVKGFPADDALRIGGFRNGS